MGPGIVWTVYLEQLIENLITLLGQDYGPTKELKSNVVEASIK
jgi:hypothetical protein